MQLLLRAVYKNKIVLKFLFSYLCVNSKLEELRGSKFTFFFFFYSLQFPALLSITIWPSITFLFFLLIILFVCGWNSGKRRQRSLSLKIAKVSKLFLSKMSNPFCSSKNILLQTSSKIDMKKKFKTHSVIDFFQTCWH